MGLIKVVLGPRRDDPDVVTLAAQERRESDPDGEWTYSQERAANAAARRLGPAVAAQVRREARAGG